MEEMNGEGKEKLLLHVCCGPCSTEVIHRLSEEHQLILFFYNPNISPPEEHDRRLAEAKRYASEHGIPLIRGGYDHDAWLGAVKGLEDEPEGGRRCGACFAFRLKAAAKKATEEGAALFSTTLTISPHKNAASVNAAGEEAGQNAKIAFLAADFKKKDGFLKSCRLASEAGMYRQDYCGCEFSRRPPRTAQKNGRRDKNTAL